MCTKFGVDSSSRFPVRAQTNRQTDKQTDAIERPTHPGCYADGNLLTCLFKRSHFFKHKPFSATSGQERWDTYLTRRYVSWNLVNRQEDRRTDGRTDSGPQHIPRWHSVVWLKTLAAKLHIERWSRQDRVRQSSEVVCPLTVKRPDSNQHWVIADYESQGYDNTRVRQSTTINCRRSVWLQTLSVIIMTSLIHGDTHRRLTPTDTSEVICRSPAYQTSPPIVAGR